MAECWNNMGCIYEIEKSYSKALECHKNALSIRDKYQIDLGSSYNNIGNIYLWLEQYDNALENYTYSFEIKSKSLSIQDPSLAKTLRNIGLVYEHDGNFEEAFKFYKKAAFIFEQIYPSVHIYNTEIQEDIQRVSSSQKSDCLDSSFD
jgi:tetratricopeptide (TPR) repeat protein